MPSLRVYELVEEKIWGSIGSLATPAVPLQSLHLLAQVTQKSFSMGVKSTDCSRLSPGDRGRDRASMAALIKDFTKLTEKLNVAKEHLDK